MWGLNAFLNWRCDFYFRSKNFMLFLKKPVAAPYNLNFCDT